MECCVERRTNSIMDVVTKILLKVAKIVLKLAKVLWKLGLLNEDTISMVGGYLGGVDFGSITDGLNLG